MKVSLTPQLQKLVDQKVASGFYESPSEVVREALRLLEERDRLSGTRLADLREKIATGLQDLDEGRPLSADEVYARLRRSPSRRKRQ